MSCWTKEELKSTLEDIVNELNLSTGMIEEHGSLRAVPTKLVSLILKRKDQEIAILKHSFIAVFESERRKEKK